MKSSSRIFKADQPSADQFVGWQLVDFDQQVEVEVQEKAAEIMSLFAPSQSSSATGVSVQSGLLRGEQLANLHKWNIPDFEYLSSLEDESGAASHHFVGERSEERENHDQQEAASIIEQARQEAAELIRRAEEEASQLRLQAAHELEMMRQNGYQAGLLQAQQEMKSALQACADLIAEAEAWKQNLVSSSEGIVLDMIREMAQVLFGPGVALDEQALQINLNRIVEQASTLGELKIYLNPQDVAHLDPSWKEYQSLVLGHKVQIIPAEGITRGGCYIQGQFGAVDARVETQLTNLLASLTSGQTGEEMPS